MVFGESPIKDAYRLVVWGPWRRALEQTPPTAEIAAHRALGRVASAVARGRREHVRERLREAFGDVPELDRWTRECFETHFTNQYVAVTFAKVDERTWPAYLEIRGREHLDAALAAGKGAVLAHPHTALPQLPLHVFGLLGYDVHQVGGGAPKVELSAVGRRAAATRARLESRIRATLHDGKAYVRPVVRALQGGAVVLTACDGTGGGEELGRRATATVLGRPMRMPVFAGWLSARTGAPVLTLWTRRNRGSGPPYVAEIEPPLPAGEAGSVELAARMERWLRASPGDWHFWDAWHDREGGLLVPS